MIPEALQSELRQSLEKLSASDQQKVLDYARALAVSRPRGTPGWALRPLVGSITTEDLNRMQQVIDEDCGRIDARL